MKNAPVVLVMLGKPFLLLSTGLLSLSFMLDEQKFLPIAVPEMLTRMHHVRKTSVRLCTSAHLAKCEHL